ncbi:UNVERIFIED_CONTAM: hypothetical protein DV032_11365 [Lacticaseibacillus paracasei]|jgi:hypothetical protein|uniref:hypothetical protein n=1 Tax=Lacticaseibacillus paracasei TaxID=1597 RepID=UPI002E2F701B|nr:hypothetical protein [Lacticaseibacillus paracasei]MED7648954.1 hypothetical protein [Lacticaseibacillus paracasei]
MIFHTINNRSQFQEDYSDTIIAGTPSDAEDALMELCDHIEPYEDGDHWLELIGDCTRSGSPVYFWFTADMSQNNMQLTYNSWAHHY